MAYQSDIKLSDVSCGSSVVLKNINLEGKVLIYLKNLGIFPGTIMKILINSINGVVVFARNGKIALGRDVASALEVDLIWQEAAPIAKIPQIVEVIRHT